MKCGGLLILGLVLSVSAVYAATPAVAAFTPTGTVKAVRQVTASFTTAMVTLGDPRLPAPFVIHCAPAGQGRWADPRHWVFDFEHDLPAAVRCRFTLQRGIHDATGQAVQGPREFTFETGGPNILQIEPTEGDTIDEEQIFILGLDVPATTESIEAHAQCRAAGVTEAIGVRAVTGDERRALLEANPYFAKRYAEVLFKDRDGAGMVAASIAEEGTVRERFHQLLHAASSPIALVQCKQRLPNGAKVFLAWGPGIAAANGLATTAVQSLEFLVREPFRATFRCERVNKNAGCIPALAMSLEFTAPIKTAAAHTLTLTDSHGHAYAAKVSEDTADTTTEITFAGPFPERTKFTLALPRDLRDDAARPLQNQARFPLAISTDDDPPLAKFAADFGVIELHGAPALPVTVRNLEANLKANANPRLAPPSVQGFVQDLARRALGKPDYNPLLDVSHATLKGRLLRLDAADPTAFGKWLLALRKAARDDYHYDEKTEQYLVTRHAGETALLATETAARDLEIPRVTPAKEFEVVGIPLEKPGLYVVELASPRLGATLFGKPGTYFAQAMALVTNLGVHLKWGRESSLVWVTALDSGAPVANAAVSIKDCAGKTWWEGRSDPHGIASIERPLPRPADLPRCEWNSEGLIASARLGDDIGMVTSEWNEGIANWQFHLPSAKPEAPELATTVFDRTLFRTGETVHMKHVLRHHTRAGFAAATRAELKIRVRHGGTDIEYPVPTTYEAATSSAESTWQIPADAKQGTYYIEAATAQSWTSLGEFRVEAYRVPLLRATVTGPAAPSIASTELTIDAQIAYLAGGVAAGLPVIVRSLVEPRAVTQPDYLDVDFMNGNVFEGVTDQAEQAWRTQPYAADTHHAQVLNTVRATLDDHGGGRFRVSDIPAGDRAQTVTAELEYHDPNGDIGTASTRLAVWPAALMLGIKPAGWALSKAHLRFQVIALKLDGKPAANAPITVDLLQRITYSHRKRLIGGFYAYENKSEIKPVAGRCSGRSDAQGLLNCDIAAPVSGNIILRAQAHDDTGHLSYANREVWVAGRDDWWFEMSAEDRMDLVPERKHYEPGETARLQVRMPFREATALVTVEREGIIDQFVTHLSGKSPVIEVPIRGHYAPNMFVSVLAVRGRDAQIQPTALVDLGRPAYKLGITELKIGYRAHQLTVKVHSPRVTYKVREQAKVEIEVTRSDGSALTAPAEVALAAVDEGLLQLRDNPSWNLLDALMGRRGAEVQTATMQMQVLGKRHFGRKALAPGGGGGNATGTRTLFDTLLLWRGRVALDPKGRATIDIPLNDSLTSFRVVVVATEGLDHFGTGSTELRTTQDVMVLAGLPPMVRAGDRFSAGFTVRNTTDHALAVDATPMLTVIAENGSTPLNPPLRTQHLTLDPGQARALNWDVQVPSEALALQWSISVVDSQHPAIRDALKLTQQVLTAVPVRTYQATLARLDPTLTVPVALPADALPKRGDLQITLQPTLGSNLAGVREYMNFYDYHCLEQLVSKAIALQDPARWQAAMDLLPSFLDGNGLAKYFAIEGPGNDSLTAYILAIAAEAGWEIPENARHRMREGLSKFIEGRLTVESAWQTADLNLRKLAAIEALSRYPEGIVPAWLDAIAIEPNLWPSSGVIDWIDILTRVDALADRSQQRAVALNILRARLNFQGTILTFSTEHDDALWWLMINADVNANRALLSVLAQPAWQEEVPRLVTGTLGRQHSGHWSTTTANAWGVLALKKFGAKFEATPVTGATDISLGSEQHPLAWDSPATAHTLALPWPAKPDNLTLSHRGDGHPWVTLQARAAIPLKAPVTSGYRATRTLLAVTQQQPDEWHVGDVYRVRLVIEAQSDMTWVVVNDPIPTGASILGGGLGNDSKILTQGEQRAGWVWPTYEERTFDSFRAYYGFVPKGQWTVEYTVRLNNAGTFALPATQIEAMYAPEMFGAYPNATVNVLP